MSLSLHLSHCLPFFFCLFCFSSALSRLCLHDGEHIGAFWGAEGFVALSPAEGERHPLRALPVLCVRPRGQQPRAPERLREGERQPAGHARVEHLRPTLTQLGTGGAGHQHLLAQLLPGNTREDDTVWSHKSAVSDDVVRNRKTSTKG